MAEPEHVEEPERDTASLTTIEESALALWLVLVMCLSVAKLGGPSAAKQAHVKVFSFGGERV